MENRQNFERLKLYEPWKTGSGEPNRVENTPLSLPLAAHPAASPDPALSILLEAIMPILERVNDALDELEAAVNRIADAPHG